jgi:hypothetical protein
MISLGSRRGWGRIKKYGARSPSSSREGSADSLVSSARTWQCGRWRWPMPSRSSYWSSRGSGGGRGRAEGGNTRGAHHERRRRRHSSGLRGIGEARAAAAAACVPGGGRRRGHGLAAAACCRAGRGRQGVPGAGSPGHVLRVAAATALA